jgi:carboxyl-terminal processing protease
MTSSTTRRFAHLFAALSLSVTSLAVTTLSHARPSAQDATAAAPARPDLGGAQAWSTKVWELAMAGDRDGLSQSLRTVPDDPIVGEGVQRIRASVDLHEVNLDKAAARKQTDMDKALADLGEAIQKNELSKALRAAVTVQTLGDQLDDAFDNADISGLIATAEAELTKAETNLDWLQAQELLYFLRTLHEDTVRVADYERFNEHLEAVNRRVSLLAQYAPRRLHELRAERAKRLGDPELGEFRWNPSMNWEEKVKGVRKEMLKSAMRTAATEHIESLGWRALIEGGLEELQILATTASLDETFPKLADEKAVQEWEGTIEKELATLKATRDADLDSWYLSRVLTELESVNERTVQLLPEVLYREFGDGAMYRLDQFSEIVWPDKLSRFKQATEGNFIGVGILIRHNDAQEIIVVNPLEGTPAYFGGVKPNDVITEVDGESTVGWSLNDAVDRITGAPETEVHLGLKREGVDGIVPLTLERKQIKLHTVNGWWKKDLTEDGSPQWDWYIDPVTRVAYLKITQFTDDTYRDLQSAWKEISAKGKPAGMIIDLRYNPGGLLSSAVQVSNLFVRNGVIVTGEDKDGKRPPNFPDQKADGRRSWDLDGVGVVVLINQGSASASEIVAGCLRAHGAAVIVGERSFGKGSVQTVHNVANDARLKLTTQYYRLPPDAEQVAAGEKGRLVHKRPGAKVWGVDPTIEVKMTPQQATEALELRQKADVLPQDDQGEVDAAADKRPDINRLLTEGIDPQLETALLILQARALGLPNTEMQHAAR